MASNNLAPVPSDKSASDLYERADMRIYHLKHFFEFIRDVAAAAPPGTTNDVTTESIEVVFSVFAEEIEAAHNEILDARQLLREKA